MVLVEQKFQLRPRWNIPSSPGPDSLFPYRTREPLTEGLGEVAESWAWLSGEGFGMQRGFLGVFLLLLLLGLALQGSSSNPSARSWQKGSYASPGPPSKLTSPHHQGWQQRPGLWIVPGEGQRHGTHDGMAMTSPRRLVDPRVVSARAACQGTMVGHRYGTPSHNLAEPETGVVRGQEKEN